MCDLLRGSRRLDEHAVHASLTLHVQVAVEDVPSALRELHDAAELDVLLERDLQLVEIARALTGGVGATRKHRLSELGRDSVELFGLRNEVGLTLQLDHRRGITRDHEGDSALRVLTIGALRRRSQAALAQQLHRRFLVAVRLFERLLAVEHAGARGLTNLLDVLGGELSHRALSLLSGFGGGCRGCAMSVDGRLSGNGRAPRRRHRGALQRQPAPRAATGSRHGASTSAAAGSAVAGSAVAGSASPAARPR